VKKKNEAQWVKNKNLKPQGAKRYSTQYIYIYILKKHNNLSSGSGLVKARRWSKGGSIVAQWLSKSGLKVVRRWLIGCLEVF
jgi:hypothetical protein